MSVYRSLPPPPKQSLLCKMGMHKLEEPLLSELPDAEGTCVRCREKVKPSEPVSCRLQLHGADCSKRGCTLRRRIKEAEAEDMAVKAMRERLIGLDEQLDAIAEARKNSDEATEEFKQGLRKLRNDLALKLVQSMARKAFRK